MPGTLIAGILSSMMCPLARMLPIAPVWKRLPLGTVALVSVVSALVVTAPAVAQNTEFKLGESGKWKPEHVPEPGSDEALIADVTSLIAANQPEAAYQMIDDWIGRNVRSGSPWLPRAYLLRGDALLALGDEFEAMIDYERNVIQRYPQSEEFVRAMERELDIAVLYANGLRRKLFGVRMLGAGDIAEETFIRVQERAPGSSVAERAAIELADFYYRKGDLPLAAEAYDLYTVNYPSGASVRRAMERRIRANVAMYKGPEFDGSSLINAMEQTKEFARKYPSYAEQTVLDTRLVSRLDDALADQMLAGAKWYLRRDDEASAKFTVRRLLKRHPGSPAAAEALSLILEYQWNDLTPGGPHITATPPLPKAPPLPVGEGGGEGSEEAMSPDGESS